MRKNCSVILVLLFVIGVCGTAWIINIDPAVVQSKGTQTTKSVDWYKRISSVATALAVIIAAVALWVNYNLNRRRVAFDSLLKLVEFFHIHLKEDRDNVVDFEIKDRVALETFLTYVELGDENAIKKNRSAIRVLNFYALMGMMIQDKYLHSDMVIKYFGSAICHKAMDWKVYLDYLNTLANYKGMINEVNYVCKLASTT